MAAVLCSLPSWLGHTDRFAISCAAVHHSELNIGPSAGAGSLYSEGFIRPLGCSVE